MLFFNSIFENVNIVLMLLCTRSRFFLKNVFRNKNSDLWLIIYLKVRDAAVMKRVFHNCATFFPYLSSYLRPKLSDIIMVPFYQHQFSLLAQDEFANTLMTFGLVWEDDILIGCRQLDEVDKMKGRYLEQFEMNATVCFPGFLECGSNGLLIREL